MSAPKQERSASQKSDLVGGEGRSLPQVAVKVLFCGEEFARGFQYSQEAVADIPNVQVIRCPRSQVHQHIGDADVAVPLMAVLDETMLSKAKQLRLILQFGVGLEGVSIASATERGIMVSNMPSKGCGNALSCAEMAIYLLLATLKQAHQMADSIQNRIVGTPIGRTLFGLRCLIVGFGNIAKELIPRLKPFGVKLAVVRQSAWDAADAPADLDVRAGWSQLHEQAALADVVILTCIITDRTRGMVDSRFLAACKKGVTIINVARGALLDYDSVKAGLQSGHIGSLGLDVQWQEPFDPEDYVATHPRVYLTPHVAGVTELSYRSMAATLAQEVRRFQQGLPPSIQINKLPSASEMTSKS